MKDTAIVIDAELVEALMVKKRARDGLVAAAREMVAVLDPFSLHGRIEEARDVLRKALAEYEKA